MNFIVQEKRAMKELLTFKIHNLNENVIDIYDILPII